MTTATGSTAAEGIALDPGEERRYRERTPRSLELLERTKPLIPTGHGGGMWYQLPYPVLLERGKGSRIWDVDGNEYVDLRLGDWVMILGHANELVRDAVGAQFEKGTQFGSPDWDLSYRMASLLIERMPSLERVRFLVSGTEANLLALRLARAHTGKTKLAKMQGSYHGHSDHMVTGSSTTAIARVAAGIHRGVLEELVEVPFNDPDGAAQVLERDAVDIAAVIVEPVQGGAGMIPATKEFLQRLREVTERLGIVLIFDEVVTFPIAYGGAQAWFGVTPDLTTMSKAIGGGLPLSAVGGRAEIMDLLDPDLHAGLAPVTSVSTFGGNLRLAGRRHRMPRAAHPRSARANPVGRRPGAERDRRARPLVRHPAALERPRPPLRHALGAGARGRLPHEDAGRPAEDRQPPPRPDERGLLPDVARVFPAQRRGQ